MTENQINRRTLAKSAARAAPAAAMTIAAPAYAASGPAVAEICLLSPGTGDINSQGLTIHFNFVANNGNTVATGTEYNFRITVESSSNAASLPEKIDGDAMNILITNVSSTTSGSARVRVFDVNVKMTTTVQPQCASAGIKWGSGGIYAPARQQDHCNSHWRHLGGFRKATYIQRRKQKERTPDRYSQLRLHPHGSLRQSK